MKQFADHCGVRVVFAVILSVCLFSGKTVAIESLELQVEPDSTLPNGFYIGNINYQVLEGNVIDFSCDVNVMEPLTFGTKVGRHTLGNITCATTF